MIAAGDIAAALTHAVETHDYSGLVEEVRGLARSPRWVQALALADLMGGRESNVRIEVAPFDLPAGWWQVTFERDGFTCGIAPDGSVSS